MTAVTATANTVRIMGWSPCEVVLVGPNRLLGQKVIRESSPAAAPRWRHDPTTNTGIMTLFRGRMDSAAAWRAKFGTVFTATRSTPDLSRRAH